MRALFINENIGGHATVHHSLRRAFAQRNDIDVEFIDANEPQLIAKVLRKPVPVLGRWDVDLQPLRSQLLHSCALRQRVADRLLQGDIDVMHVYTQNCMLGSHRLLQQVPTVVTTDSTNELNAYSLSYRTATRFTPWAVRASLPFERRVLEAARMVVSNADRVTTSLTGPAYHLAPEKVITQPMGIWSPFLDGSRRLPEPPADRRPTIVFVGAQMEPKGGNTLLDLHQRYLADRCDLLLITRDAVGTHPAVTVVNDLSSGDDRLWDLLAGADMMCFPSAIDQSPNVILEAGAAGLPVIASRTGAIPDMVVDGRTGILVDHLDQANILAALRMLLDNPAKRRDMGRAAHAHIAEHFDIQHSAAMLTALFADITTAARR
ncbi:glycosyltransferase family 4 protein [Mycolicibacterium komossense]|uniref:Glycosyltransferase family 4 protein n=1 Tax=Mycolicibacterium komossense TaxID=1779 RepID=A0ABT3CCJ3_9MYCO|nr:glycosyltransferase family 4 protein [Mycolicibacterium komossense]MCV7227179.1 glycosyltransferase family 4 protein [Mycolicibacterium komossense]